MITQYKGIAPIFQLYHLFPGDETKGIEWKGVVQFTATQGREILSGDSLVKQGIPREKTGKWSEWHYKGSVAVERSLPRTPLAEESG
jgi:hypothetical protein